MSTVYIYALVDPRSCEMRYVGQSINPLSRLRGHLASPCNSQLAGWLQDLRLAGYYPAIKILDCVPASASNKTEQYWIKKLHGEGARITNVVSIGPLNQPDMVDIDLNDDVDSLNATWLTVASAARLRGVSRQSIYSAIERGLIQTGRSFPGRPPVVSRRDVLSYNPRVFKGKR